MKIWIDLANSPHVAFFRPLLPVFTASGHQVSVTLRDFAQTVSLAEKCGIQGEIIGKHGGRSRTGKILNLLHRSIHLARSQGAAGADIAVSHNSYTHVLAARLKKIRTVTLMDYEGQPANHLAFRGAHKVIVPECFPEQALRRFGAGPKKVFKYSGFKEQLYLSEFKPDESFPDRLRDVCQLAPDWDLSETILVVVRTPATMAAYHRFENPLFEGLLEGLNRHSELTVIVLPRTRGQQEAITAQFPYLKVPASALDGNNLMFYSDVVISAGGTMNREAAILGTPAYTLFAGRLPAVDQKLCKLGRMTSIRTQRDTQKIRLEKKKPGQIMRNVGLQNEIVQAILD